VSPGDTHCCPKMESSPFFHSISKTSSSTEASSSRTGRKRSHIQVGYSAEATENAYIPEVKVVSDQPDVKLLLDAKGEIADPKSSVRISEQIKSKIDAQNHAVKSEPDDGSVKTENWEPPNWQEQLKGIQEMRKSRDAPVDTMGCERCHDHDALPNIQRYQILVSLMLSSQTRDEVTSAAMSRLKQHGLTPTKLLSMPDEVLGDMIKPVGFWRKKIVYLKKATTLIIEKYGGDIPETVEELCKLPGVGPKMAYLAVQCAWGVNVGIGVDTHVHRISQRLGWLQKPPKNPEDTRKGLEKWLPQDQWGEINALLVGFGQQVCLPVGPRCNDCGIRSICPFGASHPVSPKKSPSKKRTAYFLDVKKEEPT